MKNVNVYRKTELPRPAEAGAQEPAAVVADNLEQSDSERYPGSSIMNRILIVDDEHLILYSLSTSLKADGYAVTAVENGTSALNELSASDFDICILDVNLPDINGLDIMKVVRERSPRTGIVIITATDLTDRQIDSIRANGGRLLPKPFDLDQVRMLVAGMGTDARKQARSGTLG